MTRRILTTLALLALTAAVSAGLLHAQGSAESERAPYRIDLHPGWNLISFPGDPMDAALQSVIGDARVDVVLGYQGDDWLAAVRKAGGGWRTTTGFTTLSGGRGYWVHATASETLGVTLSSSDTQAILETTAGWNLLGVWDAEQRRAGTQVGADSYFNDTYWKAAYTYNPAAELWKKVIPNSDGTIDAGSGYWVWTSSPGCLCP